MKMKILIGAVALTLSGAAFAEIELGGVTESTSCGFCLVANMKNDNNRKAKA